MADNVVGVIDAVRGRINFHYTAEADDEKSGVAEMRMLRIGRTICALVNNRIGVNNDSPIKHTAPTESALSSYLGQLCEASHGANRHLRVGVIL